MKALRMYGWTIMVLCAGVMLDMVYPIGWPPVILTIVVGLLLRVGVAELVTGHMRIRRDDHPFPHRMTGSGGCACDCNLCVRPRPDGSSLVCVCVRCSQDCPGIGRLGDPDAVKRERPVTYGLPAGRWWVKHS